MRLPVEWGGLLRKVRAQDAADQGKNGAGAPASPTPPAPAADPAPLGATKTPNAPLMQRRAWASGAFLAAAARLVARGEETTYTLRRVVEWATAAAGARRAILWAIEDDEEQSLTTLAWAATDGWRPGEASPPRVGNSPALLRAARSPETILIELGRPMEQAVGWGEMLGIEPIAVCAAISGGQPRGFLAVAGVAGDEAKTFGEDARAALAACAALAAIVFERQREEGNAASAVADAATDAPAAEAASAPTTATVGDEPEEHGPFGNLPDRATILTRLGEEIGRARRFGHPLALLHLDVDRLGEWSAQAGERAVQGALDHLVGVIRRSIRDVDLLGRGEDDDYILILPVSEVDDALRVGERIRETLEREQPPETAGAPSLRLTVSGGAVGYPDDGAEADELLAAAERTVLYAKRMGRDQIRLRGLGEMESPSPVENFRPMNHVPITEGPRITQVFQGLIDALAAAGDAHDQARPGHGRAVGQYARALAEACGLDPDQARTIELAGFLHDAGKIGLPEGIIGKRGALTAEERATLREQPAVGKLMLMQVPSLEGVTPLVEYAHERYDGNGYPAGLRGNQIPFGSRIIALAEGYEAMTSDRPYRRALSHSMAIAELWRESGGRYDPRLVDTFVRLVSPHGNGEGAEAWDPTLLEQVAVEPIESSVGDILQPVEEAGAPADDPTDAINTPAVSQYESGQMGEPGQIGPLDPHDETPPTSANEATQEPDSATPAREQVETRRLRPRIGTGPLPTRSAAEQSAPEGDGPEQLSVNDTILRMSQTTLMRMAELGRNAKRTPGTANLRDGDQENED